MNRNNFDLKKYLIENRIKETTLTEVKYNEFMLEWIVPGTESNTIISKSLKELFKIIEEKNIKCYTIKGRNDGKWDILVNTL